jgi:hypothetical protein
MSLAAMATWVRLMYVIDPMHDFPVQKTLGDRGKKAREIFVELRREEVRKEKKRRRTDESTGTDEPTGQPQEKRTKTQERAHTAKRPPPHTAKRPRSRQTRRRIDPSSQGSF